MRVRSTSLPWARPRYEPLLLVLVAIVALLPVSKATDQDLSRLCLTQAIVHGKLSNDRCLASSFDKALFDGHLYSDKAPGMSFVELPSAEAVRLPPVNEIEGTSARLWAVRLLSSGVAFLLTAFLVGRVAEGLAPGRGGAAMVTFALGTLVALFAAVNFSHDAAAATAFATFVLAWRKRFALAGLVGGAAVVVEYQTAAVLAIVALYALRHGARRLADYALGLVPGVALLLVYDTLAFGSPFHLSYRYVALKEQGTGFFGIGLPHAHAVYEVFGGKSGLLIVSPIVVAAAYGLVLLARTHPLEAAVCGAVTVFFVLLNCGYYIAYGGTLAGPRFLVPALPFLAVGLGPAFARRPRATAVLAVASALAVFGLLLVWTQNPPLRQTIWGDLVRFPSQGRAAELIRHLSPNALGWTPVGTGGGVAVMFGAAALAFGAALAARGWSVDAIRARPARSAAFALAVVAAMLALARIATKPIEVRTAIAASTAAAFPGDEVDFVVTVTNETGTFLPNAAVVISLPQGMTLLGRPTQERGPGCTGTTTVTCDLDFLEAHMVTRVHLGVRIDPSASSKLRVRAFGKSGDVAGPTSTASVIAGAG